MDNFCPVPFHHLLVESDGNFNVCCEHIVPDDKKINISCHDVDSWLTGDYVSQVRNYFRDNKKHPGCRNCWKQESRKVESRRQQMYKEYRILGIDTKNTRIKKIEINLSNLCNLKCLMCDGNSSSALLSENQKLGLSNLSQERFKWNDADIEYLLKFIIETKPEVLAIRGGEPLYNKDLFYILSSLPDDYTNKLVLTIITNATIWNDQWKNLLSKFRLVLMHMSVDAVGDLYEYIRFPANWQAVDQNIRNIIQLPNVKAWVMGVVQNLNILHLEPLLDWSRSVGVRLQLDLLHIPEYLDVTNLPLDIKAKAVVTLDELLKKTPEPHLAHFLQNTLNLMLREAETKNQQLIEQFESIIAIRNQNRNNSHRIFFFDKTERNEEQSH